MKIIRQKKKRPFRIVKTKNISFVPTMGGLHKGHEFIKKASQKNSVVLVSIFVNPKQFNSKKDFLTYPRNFKNDVRILKSLKLTIYIFLVLMIFFLLKLKTKFICIHLVIGYVVNLDLVILKGS